MKKTLKQALKQATDLDVTRKDSKVYSRNLGTGETSVMMRFGSLFVTTKTKDLNVPTAVADAITALPGQGAVVE